MSVDKDKLPQEATERERMNHEIKIEILRYYGKCVNVSDTALMLHIKQSDGNTFFEKSYNHIKNL